MAAGQGGREDAPGDPGAPGPVVPDLRVRRRRLPGAPRQAGDLPHAEEGLRDAEDDEAQLRLHDQAHHHAQEGEGGPVRPVDQRRDAGNRPGEDADAQDRGADGDDACLHEGRPPKAPGGPLRRDHDGPRPRRPQGRGAALARRHTGQLGGAAARGRQPERVAAVAAVTAVQPEAHFGAAPAAGEGCLRRRRAGCAGGRRRPAGWQQRGPHRAAGAGRGDPCPAAGGAGLPAAAGRVDRQAARRHREPLREGAEGLRAPVRDRGEARHGGAQGPGRQGPGRDRRPRRLRLRRRRQPHRFTGGHAPNLHAAGTQGGEAER
mmetsp:Transcript_89501/g.253613  ORF Transcript_89501/g.253613 Transcript_89501/m.253613 type:complete len:319 (+) Transcript_89501:1721-2677(+)